jgi:hypothetical protein
MKTDNASSTAVRRPEDSARAAHFAYALHASLSRPRARLPWKARAATERAELAHLEDRIRQRVIAAMARASGEEVRARLVELASGQGFGRLDARIQAAALDALAEGAIDLSLVRDAEQACESEALASLEPVIAERFLADMIGRRTFEPDRAPFLALLASPGFFDLDRSEQIDLLRYLGGPRARVERRSYLESAWSKERASLLDLLRSDEYTTSRPLDQAGMLRDFIHYPSQPLYFLEAMLFGGRSIVILGDPTDPAVISYGQIPVIRVGRRRSARVESPDECVASGWTESDDSAFTYTFRVFEVSRDEARRFVEWAESAFLVDEAPADERLGPKLSFVNGRRFFDSALKVATLYALRTGGRCETGYMQLGERCTLELEAVDDRECEELLSRFLAA